jgi:hypothetical protein
MLSPLPRRSGWAYSSLCSPSRISLPRKGCRVDLRIVLFEDCSAFTRVTACTLALSPIRDTLIEGFSHFVTSMTAPIASGWSGCRVGFAPTGKRRLCTAHTHLGHWVAAFGVDWLPFLTLRPSQSVRLEASKRFSLRGIHATARFHHGTWCRGYVATRGPSAAVIKDEAHRDS